MFRKMSIALGALATLLLPAVAFAASSSDDAAAAAGGVFILLIWGVIMLVGLAVFVGCILMTVKMFTTTEQQYAALGQQKNTWLISGIVAWFLGFLSIWAIVFYFMVYNKLGTVANYPAAPGPQYGAPQYPNAPQYPVAPQYPTQPPTTSMPPMPPQPPVPPTF